MPIARDLVAPARAALPRNGNTMAMSVLLRRALIRGRLAAGARGSARSWLR